MMLSDERLRALERDGDLIGNHDDWECEVEAMARELLTRRAQDEVVADLWKVAEWAAEQECDYQHIQRRRCQYKPPCAPCLARTLQAKHKEPMSDLFLLGDFAQHSGGRSRFRIECDALSDNELKALAAMLASRLPPFGYVMDCGGASTRLAEAMRPHRNQECRSTALVDDVLTTGATIVGCRHQMIGTAQWDWGIYGAVLFAWSTPPPWVTALFTVAQGAPS